MAYTEIHPDANPTISTHVSLLDLGPYDVSR